MSRVGIKANIISSLSMHQWATSKLSILVFPAWGIGMQFDQWYVCSERHKSGWITNATNYSPFQSRRPKCNTNPIITLNSATQFIAPIGTGSSVNNSAGCGNKLYSFMPPPSSATPLATPMSETAFHDCRITAPTVASSCNGQPPKGATDALSTASTMAMVGAPLTSSDPSVLSIPATPSFTRHAIRSNYMDKSIEAKKKVSLFVSIYLIIASILDKIPVGCLLS